MGVISAKINQVIKDYLDTYYYQGYSVELKETHDNVIYTNISDWLLEKISIYFATNTTVDERKFEDTILAKLKTWLEEVDSGGVELLPSSKIILTSLASNYP